MTTPRKPAPSPLSGNSRPAARPTPSRGRLRGFRLLAWLLLTLAVAPFFGILHGEFVWDDVPQIRENGILRDAGRWSEAFTSDVWAFKGESDRPWSTYWRPLFVLWLALLYSLFGVASTLPWHAASLVLHAAVTWLVWKVACRAGLTPLSAAAVAAIFAVHPAHVESVAWISGAPDLLGALFSLLAALAFLRGGGRGLAVGLSLAAYGAALLCKESFAGLPVVLGAATWIALPEVASRERLRRVLRTVAPHLILLGFYLVARHAVLGSLVVSRGDEAPSALHWLGTVPRILAFYLAHATVPFALGPAYPLRAAPFSAGSAVLLLALLGAAAILWRARRVPAVLFGTALFFALLAPVLHLGALDPVELVHDRYLYLPLAGVWIALAGGIEFSFRGLDAARRRRLAVIAATLLVAVMATRTASYARVWHDNLALWNRGIETAPKSPTAWSHLGFARLESGAGDAVGAFDRALALAPDAHSLTGRAQARLALGDRAGAAVDLAEVLAQQPAFTQAAEQLASILVASGRLQEAETLLARTLPLAPWRRCSLTTNLAVVHYLQGRKDEALAELESLDGLLRGEPTSTCLGSLFHRAALLDELGRSAEARAADGRFLAITTGTTDAALLRLRSAARERLAEPR
ncbi:MAG: tetratricopeptide repeat protein [Thermoanaerobaculia bacterium]